MIAVCESGSQTGRAVSPTIRALSQTGRAVRQTMRAMSQTGRAVRQTMRALSQTGRAVRQTMRAMSQTGRAARLYHIIWRRTVRRAEFESDLLDYCYCHSATETVSQTCSAAVMTG